MTGITARPGNVSAVKKLVLLAPVAALVLAGCAHDPTVAAKVAGQTIPVTDVSIMADFLCASATQGHQVAPMNQVNAIAMTYLVGAKAVADLARRSHVTLPTVDSSQADRLIATMPTGQRSRARSLINEIDVAINALGASAAQQPLSALASLIQAEAKAGRFVSNPEYPTLATPDSGSLSTAVSPVAKAAAASQPDSGYLATLPTGQKCG